MSDTGDAPAGTTGPDPRDPGPARSGADEPAPDLAESLRQVGASGRASLGAFSDATKAFRSLFAADISLARSAMGRSVAFAGLAIVFGASAWLLVMASTIVVLRMQLGWSWTLSMLVCAGFSLVVTALAAWRAMHYFEHTRLKATRRQLGRLGWGELAAFTPTPGSAQSAREATEKASMELGDGEPVKDKRGIPVTPP